MFEKVANVRIDFMGTRATLPLIRDKKHSRGIDYTAKIKAKKAYFNAQLIKEKAGE